MGGWGRTLRNILDAYRPLYGKSVKRKREVRRAAREMRRNPYFDPVRKNLLSPFSKDFVELIRILSVLREFYGRSLEGTKEQREALEQRLLGRFLIDGGLPPEELSFNAVLKGALAGGGGSVRNAEGLFKSRLKRIDREGLSSLKSDFIKHEAVAALSRRDLSPLLSEFGMSTKDFRPVPAENIAGELQELLPLVRPLGAMDLSTADPVCRTIRELPGNNTSGDIEEDLYKLGRLSRSILVPDFLEKVLYILEEVPPPGAPPARTEFPENGIEEIISRFKRDEQAYITKEKRRRLRQRTAALFGAERELIPVQVYSDHNTALLREAGLPGFQYSDAMKIVKSFHHHFFTPAVSPMMNSIVLEVDFINPEQKEQFSDLTERWTIHHDKLKKFEEDLGIPSFSAVHPYLDALKKNAFLTNAEKNKAREAVRAVNRDADKQIQEDIDLSMELHKTLSRYAEDLEAKHPVILHRMMLNDKKREELTAGIGEVKGHMENYIRLIRMYAVHMSKLKSKLAQKERGAGSPQVAVSP